ncbi:unnamed protein product, partial [Rotaria socialis]
MGPALNTASALAVPTSASPCLSPIRYSLDISSINQLQSIHIDEEPIEALQQPILRPQLIDDSSMK